MNVQHLFSESEISSGHGYSRCERPSSEVSREFKGARCNIKGVCSSSRILEHDPRVVRRYMEKLLALAK